MTTTIHAPASPPPVLDLDARLALLGPEMDARLNEAALAFAINTAHIAGADPVPDIADVVPLTPTLAPAANPYDTPLAALLHRARVHIETHGWLQGGLREDHGTRRCPMGALRIEAIDRRDADDACVLLLEAIQADFPTAETIPSWNDAQTSPAPVLLYLDRAAQLAHTRSL
ncbi:hypothetical protein OHQ89_12480 [Streptomyces canus]|uniref:DUF6197 family protein n=1 Tax=Streptomyces canus TaxID=58343 RepID=UPI0030E1F2B7